jgi:hypothetical protein
MLANCTSQWVLQRQYDIFRYKRGASTKKTGMPGVEYFVKKGHGRLGVLCGKAEHQMGSAVW